MVGEMCSRGQRLAAAYCCERFTTILVAHERWHAEAQGTIHLTCHAETSLDVNTRGSNVAENVNEVVLTLTVTATVDNETAYIVELQQAALFIIAGFPQEICGEASQ